MKVLLLGSGGLLARDLIAHAPAAVELIPRTRTQLDITDPRAVGSAVSGTHPDVIINCAAYTNVDGAESERDRAYAVNSNGPGIIGRAASAPASPAWRTPLVVHLSTDYVFDGRSTRPYREDDPTNPLGVYGTSKLAGEQALAESGVSYVTVRTSWLFGLHGRSFPLTMWQRAIAGQATRVVNDQPGRPTYTVDLAGAVWELIGKGEAERGKGKTLHITNDGRATWYQVAKRIFEVVGVPELLSPCTTADFPTPAKRPAYSVLDTSRYEALTGGSLPRWEDALDRWFSELKATAETPG